MATFALQATGREFPELSKVGTALAFGVFLSASSAAAVAAAEAGAAGAEVGAWSQPPGNLYIKSFIKALKMPLLVGG